MPGWPLSGKGAHQALAEEPSGDTAQRAPHLQELPRPLKVQQCPILLAHRASPAFFWPEYLLFRQIQLAYNEFVSLQ
jgi:hypothetical protein